MNPAHVVTFAVFAVDVKVVKAERKSSKIYIKSDKKKKMLCGADKNQNQNQKRAYAHKS